MPKKLTFEYVKEFINKEQSLISTEYVNNKELLNIQCNICKQNYEQNFDRYKNGHRHQKCTYNINSKGGGIASARKRYGDTFLKETLRICELCKKEYIPKKTSQKLCDKDCAFDYTQTDSYKDKCKINGSKGGIISAEKQQRRSKNEITFANLCIEYFGKDDILCNERIFKDKNNGICGTALTT